MALIGGSSSRSTRSTGGATGATGRTATSTSRPKVESTSQTYGQLIAMGGSTSSTTGARSSIGVAANIANVSQNVVVDNRDTVVQVVSVAQAGTPASVASAVMSETDRSRIALAAVSDIANPIIAVAAAEPTRETLLAGANLNTFSLANNNVVETAIVIGSALKPKEEIKKVLEESQKVDLFISLKSKDSESVEYINLKIPELEAEFTYNFFDSEEQDILTQEDQNLDPLLKRKLKDVPRYVELTWNSIGVTEEVEEVKIAIQNPPSTTVADQDQLRRETFVESRGVVSTNSTNFSDSFERARRDASRHGEEGRRVEVTDIHNLDRAFDSTSNRRQFSNTLNSVIQMGRDTKEVAFDASRIITDSSFNNDRNRNTQIQTDENFRGPANREGTGGRASSVGTLHPEDRDVRAPTGTSSPGGSGGGRSIR